MKRVVIINWKAKMNCPVEIFSNLKILCESYPEYNYNTINNYLSKKKMPYENEEVRIERKIVQSEPVKRRQIAMVAKRFKMHEHDEEKQNLEYWLSRPVSERLDAVTRLSAQLKKHPGQRMDKNLSQKTEIKMNLEKDFTDFIELLNKYEVDYMVVGGYALAFHGEPRSTGDLDIWINCTEANAEKMVTVMIDFGMGSLGYKKEDFIEPGFTNQVGQPPLRIDIINEIEGVDFSEAVKGKQHFLSGRLRVPFIGKEDFIKNKKAAGRKKDLEDIKRVQPKRIEKKRKRGGRKRGKKI